MGPERVDALILAGGALERERFPGLDPRFERKAEIPILGRPMVERVAETARSCPSVGRVVVIGHPELASAGLRASGAVLVPERATITANLHAGLDALPGSERVLALSGDLPLLTREALEDLQSNAPAADVVFPVVERAVIEAAFPDREWIYSPLVEGRFTGCSAAFFRPEPVLRNWDWVETLLGARRRTPLGLAALFGPALVLRLLLRRLRLADVERRASQLLHLEGRAYATRYPELAMDVDKGTDITLAEQVLRTRA